MDWDSFENGNMKNKLIRNKLIDRIPDSEYKGGNPVLLWEALNRHSDKKHEQVLITEMECISGFPLLLKNWQI